MMNGLPHFAVPCPLLVMPSARLGRDKYTFLSHWINLTRVSTDET